MNAVKVSFTVFQTADVIQGASVVTGYNQNPDQLEFPTDQYCYVAIESGPSKKDKYYVARKFGNEMVDWDSNCPQELFDVWQEYFLFKNQVSWVKLTKLHLLAFTTFVFIHTLYLGWY